jgi:hypothetical protein
MPIETGRWQNISREDRIRHLCRDHLFLCKNEAVFEIRKKYIPRYYHLTPNINKMTGMLSNIAVK